MTDALGTARTFLRRLPASPDIAVALVVVLAVAMMVLPMPHVLVDALIAFNLGFAVLLLMVALYVVSPLSFSTLPGIILISTVFRLALTITTARLILAEGDAGDIIRTFGEFVISGNLIVGLVVFLIITLVQFIVIAKGAERVAEVGARFTLDALPGKQMAIDAELRNGDIDQAQAKARRNTLERESQLYGAMDGAMKFVKGDAIAGLVVIAVNMIGGLAIGTLVRGMPIGQALHEYTLLSIGDALISQIPALLLSLTAGTIVTRVTGGRDIGLGRDIAEQLVSDPRALRLAAAVLLGMAAIPGFPAPIFLVLAAAFAAASFRRKPEPAAEVAGEATAEEQESARARKPALPAEAVPVMLVLAPGLLERLDAGALAKGIARIRSGVSTDLGVLIPEVGTGVDPQLGEGEFRLDVEGVPVDAGHIRPTLLVLDDDVANLELAGIPYTTEDGAGAPVWIEAEHRPALREAGIGHLDAGELVAARLRAVLMRYTGRFVGIQETRALLARMETGYADLVKEVLRSVPVPRIAEVLRRLLEEGIPMRNTRILLEALAEWGEREQNPMLLTEYVRSGLKRQICHRHANAHKVVAAYVLEREAEEAVRAAVRDTAVGPYLVLDERPSEALLSQMRRIQENAGPRGAAGEAGRPVLLASMDIRRFVRGFLARNGVDIPVLSYQDLADEFTVQPVGSISLQRGQAKAASPARTPVSPPRETVRDAALAAG
ncbi:MULTISPECIES: type III secretion system export apparatus subunit SctV [Methylobacterium]|uniref:Protein MxiA n=4 Tax=Pseudomonadota TaxID=1224 RepID=A0ABQ4SUA1_9HYPH|nr:MULTISPECIES: type III secretion system export apparatus subunit SctV [Methylobacterium]PIU07282.1 MAG: EscV/YscV/HrcV family type III secretion system export apparatus protein [Methylobacterium sp. CG09_land_8_20_14_0_10_71_15]PIU11427.1 MAG: EscV/YscV/HrcV family type III secretion system export apparatus protein [Methylobacterium sp. CG08_land_8_20_14_0_20_71_15]GBU17819.1 type III secretion protein EivA [Methylobacterium sp.]GJE06794.1 Protein MxiA [Methylobacterium jeotgali]